jgi:cell fate regulator YaaT (PSP1 superfamily)
MIKMRIEEYAIDDFIARGFCVRKINVEYEAIPCLSKTAKLHVTNIFSSLPDVGAAHRVSYVEVRFKNSHKDFFQVCSDLDLKEGDIVAVEGNPGHDIGFVTLTGPLVLRQMQKKNYLVETKEIKKVYRKAKKLDIDKWFQAIHRERPTYFRTREIIDQLGLVMKLNDVEFQGDGTKATFYYTADGRVDFRELIKILAEEFRIRVEMRQIGVRQESARLGSLGACGRELCCTTFMSNFKSVTTQVLREQNLSLNPSKLAGLCGKLKCCMNYEVEVYRALLAEFPDTSIPLLTEKGRAFYVKSNIFKKTMYYAYENEPSNLLAIPVDQVALIQEMNKQNKIVESLEQFSVAVESTYNEIIVDTKEEDISKMEDE